MSLTIKIVLLIAYLAVEDVSSCSTPRGWKAKTIEERASIAEMVLYGKVIKSPTKWQETSTEVLPVLLKKERLYSIQLEIYCIFRGGFLPRFVNITGFGYVQGHCVENHAIESEKGIFFVRFGDTGELTAQKVNVQKSMVQAGGQSLIKVIQATSFSMRKPKGHAPSRESGGCPVLAIYEK